MEVKECFKVFKTLLILYKDLLCLAMKKHLSKIVF